MFANTPGSVLCSQDQGVQPHNQVSLWTQSAGWAQETVSMQFVWSGSWDHYRWIPRPLEEMILTNEFVSLLSHRTKAIPMDLGSHDQVLFPVLSYRESSLLPVSVSLQKEFKFLPEKGNERNFLRQCEGSPLKSASPMPWSHDPTDLAELFFSPVRAGRAFLLNSTYKSLSCSPLCTSSPGCMSEQH